MRWLGSLLMPLALFGAAADAREAVDASAPAKVSVTVYRDPNRGEGQTLQREWPQGFAMISEQRTVTLPAGESTIRFEGVAEGMVAVSAIVTGLPGGTIEKNRNADLLSPAALVDGTLGNRVRITRTNPATGVEISESAIVRTRADGGIVLQTGEGFEAVRCSGLPEGLAFDRVPQGLSAQPVFSIDTRDARGGTYTVTLTYLAWGFDWQAHYVARLGEGGAKGKVLFDLMSWLTILNDNGQSFEDAELLAVAGTLNVTSDFETLADAPEGRALQLACYPIGSTAIGSPIPYYDDGYGVPLPAAPMIAGMMMDERIMVTGARMRQEVNLADSVAMLADEEALGDLKLYRIPEAVTVAAKGMKQVAFLDKKRVEGEFVYLAECYTGDWYADWGEVEGAETSLQLETVNDEKHGLGAALPNGGITIFDPSSFGPLLISEETLRDYAVGQDVEIPLAQSQMVRANCALRAEEEARKLERGEWAAMRIKLTNVNSRTAKVRVLLGYSGEWQYRTGRVKPRLKDGDYVIELDVKPGETRLFDWQIRRSDGRAD
ncbi:DUF4139 domain-containing protein [Parerythrobacter lacustris]|uniref:DUF4139 domain-containing protein n=1 Tax=Parerythrobacter lacustris TaxID=2969984 RepID=A0ABT1XUH3_9SPHN|nr:hypothetical protein [Parerythrobacter lacustris]MCR2834541.1 hypothetical protein [Parerythrobacter lacustris]